ncbi:MAG: hypothetical protein OXC72_10485 [Roseovarius sp.]|nr:hypothetical protein [Roseovarius sp.]
MDLTFWAGLRVLVARGRRPSGAAFQGLAKVEVGLEKGEVRAAQGRLRPVADKGEFHLPGKGRRASPGPGRRTGGPDFADRVPQVEIPLLVPERPLECPAAALLDLVDHKGQHGERTEHVAKMVAAVAVVALKIVHVAGL